MSDALLLVAPLETLAKVTLLLAVAFGGRWALAGRSASLRHLWSSSWLLALLLVPALAAVLPSWRPEPPALAAPARVEPAAAVRQRSQAAPAVGAEPAERVQPPSAPGFATESPAPLASAQTAPAPDWRRLAGAAWLAGTLVLLARLLVGLARMGWIARRAAPLADERARRLLAAAGVDTAREPALLASAQLRVPVLWGHFRPALLLPAEAAGWSDERLRLVLAHELAHLDRGDWLTLLVGRLAVAIYWFHPLAWALEAAARRDCEEACDDRVLSTGAKASDYAGHLVALARQLPPRPLGAVAPAVPLLRPSQIERRVRAILSPGRRRAPAGRRVTLGAAAALTLLLVPLASVRLAAWDPVPERLLVLGVGSEASDWAGSIASPAEDGASPGDWSAAEEPPVRLAQVERRAREDDRKVRRTPRDGAEWFEHAFDLHRAERYEEAVVAFRRAAELGHRPATASYNAACGYAQLGLADEALHWLEEAFAAGFESTDLLFEDSDLDPLRGDRRFLALLEAQGGSRGPDRWQEATRRFEDLRRSGSSDGEAWHDVGTDLLALQRLDEAATALEQAVAHLGEGSSTALYNLACSYAQAGAREAALDALERAVAAGFDSHERFANDRDLDPVRETSRFAEIETLHDDLSLARFSRHGGRKDRGEDGRWREAVAHFRALTAERPDSGRAWFALGYSLHEGGEHLEAVRAFRRAADLGYREATASYNTACAYAMAGETAAALDWLGRASAAGFDLGFYLEGDDDLDSLRGDPGFRELARQARADALRREIAEKKQQLEGMLEEMVAD